MKENTINGIDYTGKVLGSFTLNHYDDSYQYARVWDGNEIRDFEIGMNYDYPDVVADATKETIEAAYASCYKAFEGEIEWFSEAMAKRYTVGDTIEVVRGRKIPKGTVGTCFWKGSVYNYYSHKNEQRVGIEVDGERMFLSADYCINHDWKNNVWSAEEKADWCDCKARSYIKCETTRIAVGNDGSF